MRSFIVSGLATLVIVVSLTFTAVGIVSAATGISLSGLPGPSASFLSFNNASSTAAPASPALGAGPAAAALGPSSGSMEESSTGRDSQSGMDDGSQEESFSSTYSDDDTQGERTSAMAPEKHHSGSGRSAPYSDDDGDGD